MSDSNIEGRLANSVREWLISSGISAAQIFIPFRTMPDGPPGPKAPKPRIEIRIEYRGGSITSTINQPGITRSWPEYHSAMLRVKCVTKNADPLFHEGYVTTAREYLLSIPDSVFLDEVASVPQGYRVEMMLPQTSAYDQKGDAKTTEDFLLLRLSHPGGDPI